jgi:hypothetical protein
MFYSFATMERYADSTNHDAKPYWCVVIEYQESDAGGPRRSYLTGPSDQNLTKEEARQRADELDLTFRQGFHAAANGS